MGLSNVHLRFFLLAKDDTFCTLNAPEGDAAVSTVNILLGLMQLSMALKTNHFDNDHSH